MKKIKFCLIIIALIVVFGLISNCFITETVLTPKGKLNDSLKNKIIVHISDLHIASLGNKEKSLLEKINNIKPDIIFLTGDYVKWDGDYVKWDGDYAPAMKFFSMLKAEIGIWAVMGDYDYSNSRKSCLFCHKEGSVEKTKLHNVKFLKNSDECLSFDGERIDIIGIDGVEDNSHYIEQNINQTENNFSSIILSHNPLNFDLIDKSKNILLLAGDTHGGQIPLPSWLWGLLGYEKNEKYNYGLYEDGQKKMFVTRGIGTSHFPIRLFCPPEIVVFHF